MPYRADVFARGHYYHIYNRGLGLVYSNRQHYEHCLRLVKRHHHVYGATVIAYCLMPNHYHFLLRQETDVPLSKFVNVLFNAYVQAVNLQQGRRGPLFEERFRHVWVDHEEYLLHLCRYIHLNPVEAHLVAEPGEWAFSNYLEWIGRRPPALVDEAFIREHFGSREDYRRFVADYQDELRSRPHIARYLVD